VEQGSADNVFRIEFQDYASIPPAFTIDTSGLKNASNASVSGDSVTVLADGSRQALGAVRGDRLDLVPSLRVAVAY